MLLDEAGGASFLFTICAPFAQSWYSEYVEVDRKIGMISLTSTTMVKNAYQGTENKANFLLPNTIETKTNIQIAVKYIPPLAILKVSISSLDWNFRSRNNLSLLDLISVLERTLANFIYHVINEIAKTIENRMQRKAKKLICPASNGASLSIKSRTSLCSTRKEKMPIFEEGLFPKIKYQILVRDAYRAELLEIINEKDISR